MHSCALHFSTAGTTRPALHFSTGVHKLEKRLEVFPDVDDDVHVLCTPETLKSRLGDEQFGDSATEKYEPVPNRGEPINRPHEHRDVVGDPLSH